MVKVSFPVMSGITVITLLQLALLSQGDGNPMAAEQADAVLHTLREAQNNLQHLLQERKLSFSETEAQYKQLNSSKLPEDAYTSFFNGKFSLSQNYLTQSQQFTDGANKMLDAMERLGGKEVKKEWILEVENLQKLAKLSIQRTGEAISALSRGVTQVSDEKEAVIDTKATQLNDTKLLIDTIFAQLRKGTIRVGQQASVMMDQCLNQLKVLVLSNVALPAESDAALQELTESMAPMMSVLNNLHPYDVEMAMSDAHHAMDDVKTILYKYHIPTKDVRKYVTPCQTKTFGIITTAKNIHSAMMDQIQSEKEDV